MPLAAVTFDAGGTLFDLAETVATTYARMAAKHGLDIDADALEARFEVAFATAPPLAFPGASPAGLPRHERAWWYTVAMETFGTAASTPGFDACFEDLFVYYGSTEAWRVFPEVPAVLETLRRRGLRLVVVSNFDARLEPLLRDLGLRFSFEQVVRSTQANAAKPDPRIFHEALRLLGLVPDAVCHVGDSPREDVEGARRAGLRAVLVDRRGRKQQLPPGVASLPTLAGLPDLLAAQP